MGIFHGYTGWGSQASKTMACKNWGGRQNHRYLKTATNNPTEDHLDLTWRIIPFSKWLITMVNKSPKDRATFPFLNGLTVWLIKMG